jgi:hypothetical protein
VLTPHVIKVFTYSLAHAPYVRVENTKQQQDQKHVRTVLQILVVCQVPIIVWNAQALLVALCAQQKIQCLMDMQHAQLASVNAILVTGGPS